MESAIIAQSGRRLLGRGNLEPVEDSMLWACRLMIHLDRS